MMPIPPPSRVNPEVSREVDQLVLTALERDPSRRWQSAAAMRDAIATHASRRLTPQQLVAWVEWAFSQKQPLREDSAVAMLHEIVESKQVLAIDQPRAMAEAMEVRRRESVAATPAYGAPTVPRRTSRRWIWMAILILVMAGAGFWLVRELAPL